MGLLLGGWIGCGPAVDRDEMGEVLFTLPRVPGTERPYEMPEPYFVPEDQQPAGPESAPPPAERPGGDGADEAAK